jgi:hypothetical protein
VKQTKISFNLDGLEDMRKKISGSMKARVGILGSHAIRTGSGFYSRFGYEGEAKDQAINNAELGLIMMYGSITNNIPPRDFLVMPLEMKKRELVQVLAGGGGRRAFEAGDYRKLFLIMGATAVGFIDEAFATGGFGLWAPNAPSTIRQKGSSAPLIDEGELRKAQSFDIVTKGGAPSSLASPVNP